MSLSLTFTPGIKARSNRNGVYTIVQDIPGQYPKAVGAIFAENLPDQKTKRDVVSAFCKANKPGRDPETVMRHTMIHLGVIHGPQLVQ